MFFQWGRNTWLNKIICLMLNAFLRKHKISTQLCNKLLVVLVLLLSCLCCSSWLFPDGFLYLVGGNEERRIISSPLINTKHQELMCVRFSYYSGRKYFKRYLRLSTRKKNITEITKRWAIDRETDVWSYVQFPIARNVEQV